MENEMHDMMERLRNFRAIILQGNDKLDKIRLVQQWNEVCCLILLSKLRYSKFSIKIQLWIFNIDSGDPQYKSFPCTCTASNIKTDENTYLEA